MDLTSEFPRKRGRYSTAEYGSELDDDFDDSEDDEDQLPLSQTDNAGPDGPSAHAASRGGGCGCDRSGDAGEDVSFGTSAEGGSGEGLKFIATGKSLHDRCHGPISLEPLLVRVMDTREFQRLRGLKQLGGSAFVYPDAVSRAPLGGLPHPHTLDPHTAASSRRHCRPACAGRATAGSSTRWAWRTFRGSWQSTFSRSNSAASTRAGSTTPWAQAAAAWARTSW